MLFSISFERFYWFVGVCIVSLFPVLSVSAQDSQVVGNTVENIHISSFTTDNFLYTKSVVDLYTRIENNGIVPVQPTGWVEIFNMFGRKVATRPFNESSAYISPTSVHYVTTNWESATQGFGRYQAILRIVYGEKDRQTTISSTTSFWILPIHIILPVLGVLAFLLLSAYISVKLDVNKTIINISSGTRRVVTRRKTGDIATLLIVTIVMLAVVALFLVILLALFS